MSAPAQSVLPQGVRDTPNNRALREFCERAAAAINQSSELTLAARKIVKAAESTTSESDRRRLRREARASLTRMLAEWGEA